MNGWRFGWMLLALLSGALAGCNVSLANPPSYPPGAELDLAPLEGYWNAPDGSLVFATTAEDGSVPNDALDMSEGMVFALSDLGGGAGALWHGLDFDRPHYEVRGTRIGDFEVLVIEELEGLLYSMVKIDRTPEGDLLVSELNYERLAEDIEVGRLAGSIQEPWPDPLPFGGMTSLSVDASSEAWREYAEGLGGELFDEEPSVRLERTKHVSLNEEEGAGESAVDEPSADAGAGDVAEAADGEGVGESSPAGQGEATGIVRGDAEARRAARRGASAEGEAHAPGVGEGQGDGPGRAALVLLGIVAVAACGLGFVAWRGRR